MFFFRRVSNSSRFKGAKDVLYHRILQKAIGEYSKKKSDKRTPKRKHGREDIQMLSRTCSVGVRMDSEEKNTVSSHGR